MWDLMEKDMHGGVLCFRSLIPDLKKHGFFFFFLFSSEGWLNQFIAYAYINRFINMHYTRVSVCIYVYTTVTILFFQTSLMFLACSN